MNQVQNREFRLHKDILFTIIQRQGGSLSKAMLELVMNSVDAGASRVDVSISETHLQVRDDGRGFTQKNEIEEFFETFGTPHAEGDARYGKFRMGRGQIMVFGKNAWRSGPFRMQVNLRDDGMKYLLEETLPLHQGCSIDVEFYTPLRPSERLAQQNELASMIRFSPVPVFINGAQESRNVNEEKWTHEDEFAYYRVEPSSAYLQVYNLGVHVRDFPAGQVGGAGGLVVSKKPLELNFARNDVMTGLCKVWPKIREVLRSSAVEEEVKSPRKTWGYRFSRAALLLSGDFSGSAEFYEALLKEPIFTDVRSRHFGMRELLEEARNFKGRVTVAPSKGSVLADKVHQQKLAFVLSPDTLGVLRATSMKEAVDP